MYTRPWPIPSHDATTLHHLTDSHMAYSDPYGGWDEAKLYAVSRDVHDVFIRNVDGMVHTGDIADNGGGNWSGDPQETTQDRRTLAWLDSMETGVPSVWVPGNHDIGYRDGDTYGEPDFTSAAWAAGYGRPANGFTDMGDVRVIWFTPDKYAEVGPDEWVIDAERLEWIDQQCQATTRPVILANHFPLAELNVQNGFAEGNSYVHPKAGIADVIGANPNVAGMMSGHRHHPITKVRSTAILEVGGRNIAHLCGPSLAMADRFNGYGSASQVGTQNSPQYSMYVSINDPTHWEIRYRTHTPRRWDAVDGFRVTVLDTVANTETQTQGEQTVDNAGIWDTDTWDNTMVWGY